MEQTTSYFYDPIQPDQVRLCRFLQDGEYLSAALETFSVDGPPPRYTALSYTWALHQRGPTKNWTIQIGEKHLPVLDSLQPFVQALRTKGTLLDGTWWWIDSICIDPANTPEKNEHVRRMKRTYQNAHQTVVWLGEQSDDSGDAIDFINFLDEMSRARDRDGDMRMILQKDQYHPQWIALRNFFLRKWWTRIWTVQEFVISSSISFWCGMRDISRTAVCTALWIADRCSSTGFKDTIAFHHAWSRRRAWRLYKNAHKTGKDLSLSLLALAAYFCTNEATHDQDRLYGLHALCTEHHALDINYSWSVDEVYLRFTQSFITQHQSLDIICFGSLFSTTPGSSLPSWVPDWRQRIQPLVVPLMVSQSSDKHVGNLRPPGSLAHGDDLILYSASKTRAAVYKFEGSTLLARGSIIDAVDGLAGSRNFEFVQSSGRHSAHCSDGACSLTNVLTSVCRSLVLDRKDRYLRYIMPTEQFYYDFIHLCMPLISGSPRPVHQEFQEWFERTRLLRIHGNCLENILRDGPHSFLNPAPNQDEHMHDSFYGRFFDTVERMSLRLMTSRNNRVGMVPEKSRKGDLVCVLLGCSVPVLLRETEHEGQYINVGECFLDQCMVGEAVGQSDWSERTFCII